jgi:hypothetical protein
MLVLWDVRIRVLLLCRRHVATAACQQQPVPSRGPSAGRYCQSSKVLCTDRNRGLLDWRTNRPAIGSVSCTQHAANRSCATTQTPDTALSCPELQLSTSRKLCDGCLLPRRALACYFVRFCQIQATQLVCQSGSIGDQSHSDPCTKPWNFDNTANPPARLPNTDHDRWQNRSVGCPEWCQWLPR